MTALHLQHVRKRFGATQALDDASLKVERGTIHGLVGENGAGKSTLIKILAGIHAADAGQVSIDGRVYDRLSPRQVDALGVQFIHQERLLPASFTVGEALFFGHCAAGRICPVRRNAEPARLRGSHGLPACPGSP